MNFKRMMQVGALTVFAASAGVAHANAPGLKKLVIKYHGEQFRGANTLKLKQALRFEYPNLQLKKFALKKAKLVAKTKAGNGKATLIVGNYQSRMKTVDGHPSDFHYNDPSTYDRVVFQGPRKMTAGPWQMALKGNFKVKKVVVFLKKKHQQRLITLDKFRIPALGSREFIDVYRGGIQALVFSSIADGAQVRKVIVKYGNGRVEQLRELKGLYRPGMKRVANIAKNFGQGRNIKEIIVISACPPWATRSGLLIQAKVAKNNFF